MECFIVAYSLKDFRLLPVSFTGKVTAQTEAAQLKHVAIYKTGHVTYEKIISNTVVGNFLLLYQRGSFLFFTAKLSSIIICREDANQ
jgi:hypothetical protein